VILKIREKKTAMKGKKIVNPYQSDLETLYKEGV